MRGGGGGREGEGGRGGGRGKKWEGSRRKVREK